MLVLRFAAAPRRIICMCEYSFEVRRLAGEISLALQFSDLKQPGR